MSVIRQNIQIEKANSSVVRDFITQGITLKPELNHIDVDLLEKAILSGISEDYDANDMLIFISETASQFTYKSYDYALLAGRMEMLDLYKSTADSFRKSMNTIQDLLLPEFLDKVNTMDLDALIKSEHDFTYDVIGIRTLKRSYLLKDSNGKIIERPQYMLMRVSAFLNDDLESIRKTYDALRQKYYTHASPTLFNSGTINSQLASCFLLPVQEDSLTGIFKTLNDCAQISKLAGGIGFSCTNVRGKGSLIKKLNGRSDGLVPMLKVYNHTARYVNQGGKRKGAFASYLEPWHPDIEDWVQLKLNHGDEEMRARDLFYGLWIPDNFMRAVEKDKDWYLICPSDAPDLQDAYGEKFEQLYNDYVEKGMYKKKIKARQLWSLICKTQIETGGPYVMYKDAVNRKNNQKNLGTIRSSNLCAEICEFNSPDEIAVCTLASLCLPKFVSVNGFNFRKLKKAAYICCKNLNKVIDKTTYPLKEAYLSNNRHRPIGIGVQGLADVFQMLNIPYDSEKAKELNKEIFETIYYGAMSCSVDLAEKNQPYTSFEGSPLSEGKFAFDLWNVEPTKYEWNELRERVKKFGAVNSLLIACMPTASTAQINGNTESFEPCTSNLYVRRVLSGEFMIVNKNLESICRKQGLWTDELVNKIIKDKGSVQHTDLPEEIKKTFKTVWEISNKAIIDLSADRGAFVCQSQSLNLYLNRPNAGAISSMQFYAWKKGLKTGQYYLRTQAKASAIQFTCESCSA